MELKNSNNGTASYLKPPYPHGDSTGKLSGGFFSSCNLVGEVALFANNGKILQLAVWRQLGLLNLDQPVN